MRGRGARREYGWNEARHELEQGIHPAVVAARLGEPEHYVLEVAERQGWPVSHVSVTPDQILDAAKWADA